MAPENTTTGATATQEVAGAQPSKGTSQSQVDDAQTAREASADSESGSVDVAQLKRDLGAKNREAANLRTRLKELEDADKARSESQLSEVEKLQRKVTELERQSADKDRQLQERMLRGEIIRQASRLGYADPEDAVRFLDVSDVEFEADGTPKGVQARLKSLLSDKPYLASAAARATGSADGAARGASGPAALDMDSLLRKAAGKG